MKPDGILLLDKPAGITSARAVASARRALDTRKAGHTGTLDPFATGLLPVVFGEATKFARFLSDARKSYVATLRLGEETSTGDVEGTVTATLPVEVSPSRVDAVLDAFRGVQRQTPPMHSAVRVNGRRLYEYARKGEEIERASREIEVSALDRRTLSERELVIELTCSKGTYVRTLAQEIGRGLGCGAHLVGLRRTGVGPFRVEEAVGLEELLRSAADTLGARLLPAEALVASLPRFDTDRDEARRLGQGQSIVRDPPGAEGEVALFAPGGRFIGVGLGDASGRLVPVRLLAGEGVSNGPDFA